MRVLRLDQGSCCCFSKEIKKLKAVGNELICPYAGSVGAAKTEGSS